MSRAVTTADVLDSFANILYGKARGDLELTLLDRNLLGDVEPGRRGQVVHDFATDALACLRDAGRLPDDIDVLQATVFMLERLTRIVGLGIPPAKRVAEAFRAKVNGLRAEDQAGLADATARVKAVLGAALVDYLDDRCSPDDALPPR